MTSHSCADPNGAAGCLLQVAKKIVQGIAAENKDSDLDALERELEVEDRKSALFYGEDDLGHDAVVAAASKQT